MASKTSSLMTKLTAFSSTEIGAERGRDAQSNYDENMAIFAENSKDQRKQIIQFNSYGSLFDKQQNKNKESFRGEGSGDQDDDSIPSVAEIIGSFGWFQFLVLLFSGLRESAVGYDSVIMSVILQPEWDFVCADPLPASHFHLSQSNSSLSHNSSAGGSIVGGFNVTDENFQCYQSINGHVLMDAETSYSMPTKCQSWIFPNVSRVTSLVTEWSLVCDRHWLIAAIECAYFLGLVTGNLVWGYYADKVGRRRAYLVAHTLALIFGWLAVFMPTIELFTLCRFFCAFGSIGYNIIYSIQVEIIGTKHRSFSTTLNHLGWGIGVICVPFIDRAFNDYRYIIAVGPMLTSIM